MKQINQNYGGLVVESIDQNTRSSRFANNYYKYTYYRLNKNESKTIDGANHTIIVPLAEQTNLKIDSSSTISGSSQYFLGETQDMTITALTDDCIFVIGTYKNNKTTAPIAGQIIHMDDCKLVTKPWGYELWLTGDQTKFFAFKKILIRAGNKTSLQYHNEKRETNFLFSGKANLYFAKDAEQPPETVTANAVTSTLIEGPIVVDVINRKVHRLEAITDILLFEISTPQLDDVIRISDDTSRGNGRIESEHHGALR